MDQSLQKYRALLSVAETGSFTVSAKKLGFTQSGISRMIQSLEAELGLRLVMRDRRVTGLTPEGKRLIPKIKALCNASEALEREAEGLTDLVHGSVRIGAFSSIATYWLPKVIANFKQDYPGIKCEILMGGYSQVEQWVLDGTADFGFTILPASKNLKTAELFADEYMAIVPKGHKSANAKSFDVKGFANEPFVRLASDEDDEIAAIFDDLAFDAPDSVSVWDDYAIMSMVECGLGLGILPNLILSRCQFEIEAIPLEPQSFRHIALAMRNEDTCSLAADAFLDFLYLDYPWLPE